MSEVLSGRRKELLLKIARTFTGEKGGTIVKALLKLKKATDDKISLETKIPIFDVRKVLHRLYELSLLDIDRVQDERSGWLIFYWKIRVDQIEGIIQTQKKRVLDKLQARLEYEKAHEFYHCGTKSCRRLTFEEAVEYLFTCPNCQKPLQHASNEKIVEALEKRIELIKSELSIP